MKRLLSALLILSMACAPPKRSQATAPPPTFASYRARVKAGWLAAAIGGAMGMPAEGWRAPRIREVYEPLGAWPVEGYLPYVPRKNPRREAYTLDHWGPAGFGPDDDTFYQVANLVLAEQLGPAIASQDIAAFWRSGYRTENIAGAGIAVKTAEKRILAGIDPPESGQHEYGAWVGGQMKGEFWGYLFPGQPALAAEYGRRDAEVAFSGDGVHGEMFMAAVVAAAFVEDDIPTLLRMGLEHIPRDSSYAECIRQCLAWHEERPGDWAWAHAQMVAAYGDRRGVYPNNAIIALSLLYGEKDLRKTLGISVMSGWDTDTNAGDAGPVLGVMLGLSAIPADLAAPLDNRFRSSLEGHEEWTFDELADRTARLGVRFQAELNVSYVAD